MHVASYPARFALVFDRFLGVFARRSYILDRLVDVELYTVDHLTLQR